MTITKNIGYAYPSSPLAKELGYNTTGCYYLAVYSTDKPITRYDVVYAARSMDNVLYMVPTVVDECIDWGMWSMYKG